MPERRKAGQTTFTNGTIVTNDDILVLVASELHTLSQPLSTLYCRLQIGLMEGSAEEMAKALRDALVECERVNQSVRSMQLTVHARQQSFLAPI